MIAFVISWSPYCVVSVGSTIRGVSLLSPDISLIPEVMAKASVVSNPIIYCGLKASFRATFYRLVRRCFGKGRHPERRYAISASGYGSSSWRTRSNGSNSGNSSWRNKSDTKQPNSDKVGETAL